MTFDVNSNLESRLREIARRQGRDVQTVVTEVLKNFADAAGRSNGAKESQESLSSERYPLRGTVLQYDDPYAPAGPDSDWEAAH